MITVALPKGRLAEQSIELFEKCGIDCVELKIPTRKLVLFDKSKSYKFIFVKPGDVPTYVERGIADIGISGADTLAEERKDIYEMANLKIGGCSLCVAGFEGKIDLSKGISLKAATKYPKITHDYFLAKGINADIIKLNGSVELAAVTGLSDVIIDIVESGKTLQANGLTILDTICKITAKMIVNKVSLKTKSDEVLPLIEKFKIAAEE